MNLDAEILKALRNAESGWVSGPPSGRGLPNCVAWVT